MSQSVTRAARIIDSVAAEPKTVIELATEFDLHRSTMFRELQALEQVGYVRRRRNGTYALGFRLISLSQTALDTIDLREAAGAHVRRLHKAVGNTVHVAALMEHSIIYVDKVEDAGGVRMYSRVGAAVRPYCSAVGKAILADLDEAARDRVLAGADWVKHTEATILTRAALDAELDRISEQGWAADDGEHEDFVNCIAVPVRSSAGIVGALSVTAIRMVEDLNRLTTYLPVLQQTAAQISRELG
ncbi:IclR family transcriptional regulator [Agromyces silvae]|uniref:IclR family transcriptional regulator n=1 Tax=Agromyces silvae TaxID=3388266 RepID=UPI00280B9951|nr:IclR family transcriptional regulator [Agromyces protaetiae]